MSGRGRSKYSPEQKLKAVQLIESGKVNVPEVAETLGIHRTAVYRWVDLFKEKGRLAFFPEERKILIANEVLHNDSMEKVEGLLKVGNNFLEHIAAYLDADLHSRLFEIDKNQKKILKVLEEKAEFSPRPEFPEKEVESDELEIEELETESGISEISSLIADDINGDG
jgi:transposase-like protein